MKVIKPVTVTNTVLLSSNVTDTSGSYTAWNSATSYTIGAVVYRSTTHRIYKCLIAGVDSTLPEDSVMLTVPRWADFGPINRWAMFDNQVSTETSKASPIIVTLKPGIVNSLALINVKGVSVSVVMANGGSTVYSKSKNLDMSEISDWYSYFFSGFDQLEQVVFTDLPPYAAGEITVTISGSSTVSCGALIVGSAYNVGPVKYEPTIEIQDYSVKQTDEFGTTTFVKRRYAKKAEYALWLENNRLNSVFTMLASLRATPSVWIAHDDDRYSLLTVFGWYAAVSITIPYPNHSLCTLQLQGLT
jgi:hypothetical protein